MVTKATSQRQQRNSEDSGTSLVRAFFVLKFKLTFSTKDIMAPN